MMTPKLHILIMINLSWWINVEPLAMVWTWTITVLMLTTLHQLVSNNNNSVTHLDISNSALKCRDKFTIWNPLILSPLVWCNTTMPNLLLLSLTLSFKIHKTVCIISTLLTMVSKKLNNNSKAFHHWNQALSFPLIIANYPQWIPLVSSLNHQILTHTNYLTFKITANH